MDQNRKKFPESLIERYEPLGFLGASNQSNVFKARDKILNTEVAIKVISQDAGTKQILRFQQEAKTISKLNHPNLVKIMSFDTTNDDTIYMVLEYLDGQSLDKIIEESFSFSTTNSITLFTQLADGMAHAHANSILHRDLKPGNIIILHPENDYLQLKIIDFGIAKFLDLGVELTTGQIAIGTPAYMSPEQGKGKEQEIDERSDIYSYGCIVYETITGHRPYSGENALDMLYKHASAPIPNIESENYDHWYIEKLNHIVKKCLQKEPEDRYSSFSTIKDEFKWIGNEYRKRQETERQAEIEARETPISMDIGETTVPNIDPNAKKKLLVTGLLVSTFSILALAFTVYKASLAPADKIINRPIKNAKDLANTTNIFNTVDANVAELRKLDSQKLKYMADQSLKNKDLAGEIAYLNVLLEREPDEKIFLKRRAVSNMRLTNEPAALKDVNKLLEMDPGNSNYEEIKAECLSRSMEPDEAITMYDRLEKKYPENYNFLDKKIHLLFNQGQYQNTIKSASKFLKKFPRHYPALKLRGRSYEELGDYKSAIKDFSTLLKAEKDNEQILIQRAQAYDKLGDTKKALTDLTSAINSKRKILDGRDHGQALILRAQIYDKLGDTKKALGDRKRLRELN